MLKPLKNESEYDFLSRFIFDTEMGETYPDEEARTAAGLKTYRGNDASDDEIKDIMKKILSAPAKPIKNAAGCGNCHHGKGMHDPDCAVGDCSCQKYEADLTNARGQSAKMIPMRFIEPGLVHYNDVGTVLVRKETLDKMMPSFVGKPIFNEMHKDVSDQDFSEGKADGVVSRTWYNSEDGWFWADTLIWDKATIQNGRDGYSLSCAYDVTKWGNGGGVHNNIPYDREVLGGEYTHLAIVNNPRYEGAKLIINQGGRMKLKFWEKDKKAEDAPSEVELTNSKVDIEGKEVSMEEIVKGYQAEEKRKAVELENATRKFDDGDMIDVNGKKIPIKDLKAGYQASLKNAEDEAKKKDKDDEERKNAEAKEKDEKEKEERENRKNDEEHEKGDHKDKPMENCLKCEVERKNAGSKHFDDLRNAASRRDGKFVEPSLSSVQDKVAKGNERYGAK